MGGSGLGGGRGCGPVGADSAEGLPFGGATACPAPMGLHVGLRAGPDLQRGVLIVDAVSTLCSTASTLCGTPTTLCSTPSTLRSTPTLQYLPCVFTAGEVRSGAGYMPPLIHFGPSI